MIGFVERNRESGTVGIESKKKDMLCNEERVSNEKNAVKKGEKEGGGECWI